MSAVPTARLAEVFVEIADTLVDDFDLIEFLQRVTTRSTELAGVTAAGLLLADGQGQLSFMAASDERTRLLELFQVQSDEGPCRDCFHQGSPVMETDLGAADDRWPRFAALARDAGFGSVHAFPLRLRGNVIGALGLFGTGSLDASSVRIVQALADVATIGLLQERAIHRGELLTEQLQGALNSRIVIEQAKGVIAQLYGTSVDDAFDLLRAYCRGHGLHLSKVAAALVADVSMIPDLRQQERPTRRPT
jgi:GAF domain-containing protein